MAGSQAQGGDAYGRQAAVAAVLLPTRPKKEANGTAASPIWSLDDASEPAPLASKCDQHHMERKICCRELKGDDERSLIDPDIVRDIIIGLADGLTVPFALTAGLSSLGSSRLVYVAGIAELVSGAISMGVGGFLSAQGERDHFRFLKKATRERVARSCAGEMERETAALMSPFGIDSALSRRIAGSLLQVESTLPPPSPPRPFFHSFMKRIARRPRFSGNDEERRSLLPPSGSLDGSDEGEKGMTAFLLRFGEGVEEVSNSRLVISALTIGSAYFIGGLIPLIPYFVFNQARIALYWSIGVTTIILLLFGAFKTFYTGAAIGIQGYLVGCLSTLAVGGAAAGASFGIVNALEGGGL